MTFRVSVLYHPEDQMPESAVVELAMTLVVAMALVSPLRMQRLPQQQSQRGLYGLSQAHGIHHLGPRQGAQARRRGNAEARPRHPRLAQGGREEQV